MRHPFLKSPTSESEDRGLAAIGSSLLKIYSVGISTGASAEIRMALENSKRMIVATTLDEKGSLFAKREIEKRHLQNQIEVKIEDVSSPLPYRDGEFDFIYARLVLHYLGDPDLRRALKELYRILKPKEEIFIVVRSEKTEEAIAEKIDFDPITHLTSFNAQGKTYKRRFHSEDSIRDHLIAAQFEILSIAEYKEQLYIDFERTKPSHYVDTLLEILAFKP